MKTILRAGIHIILRHVLFQIISFIIVQCYYEILYIIYLYTSDTLLSVLIFFLEFTTHDLVKYIQDKCLSLNDFMYWLRFVYFYFLLLNCFIIIIIYWFLLYNFNRVIIWFSILVIGIGWRNIIFKPKTLPLKTMSIWNNRI